jgi:HlyD family secretion protein
MIFQDPAESLDARMSVRSLIEEPYRIHGMGNRAERKKWVDDLLETVGLSPSSAEKYSFEFSGGQRQRIGIARALYHEADVLIFDEATSALDGITEKKIIMIAHRLKTVQKCDTIFMIDQGKVTAQGTFEELLKTNQHFKRMASHA